MSNWAHFSQPPAALMAISRSRRGDDLLWSHSLTYPMISAVFVDVFTGAPVPDDFGLLGELEFEEFIMTVLFSYFEICLVVNNWIASMKYDLMFRCRGFLLGGQFPGDLDLRLGRGRLALDGGPADQLLALQNCKN